MFSVSNPSATVVCEACGKPLAAGVDLCPHCGQELPSVSGRMVLIAVVLSLIVLFALTQYLVSLHRQRELTLAQTWFARGDRAMEKGYPAIAAEDYRTALSYDRENRQYRLRLAQALLAENHYPEASSHLLNLWEEDPADGEVNLTQARLYAKQGNRSESVRYYRNAVNGAWDGNAREQRSAARFELVQYLLKEHDKQQATAELIALTADPPEQEDRKLELAQLLLQMSEYPRAQDVYESVLSSDPTNSRAWLGDGEASFAMGDYREAERKLAAAVEHNPGLADAREELELVREVLRVAPGLRGLSLEQRAQRVALAFDAALDRLTSCASRRGYNLTSPGLSAKPANGAGLQATPAAADRLTAARVNLQQLHATALQMKSAASERALLRHPDSLEPTMDFVFRVENATQPLCPDLSVTDRALLVLAQHQSGMMQ